MGVFVYLVKGLFRGVLGSVFGTYLYKIGHYVEDHITNFTRERNMENSIENNRHQVGNHGDILGFFYISMSMGMVFLKDCVGGMSLQIDGRDSMESFYVIENMYNYG